MSIQNFLAWVQNRYQLANRTASVVKAAELMRVKEITVWQWVRGVRNASPSMLLLMELIARYY